MFKIFKRIQFDPKDNRMKSIANTKIARDLYYSAKSKNVEFLLNQRFSWMNKYINEEDNGIEVGSGAGFSKEFINNKNFKLTDLGEDDHLDFKNIDAQKTGFDNGAFDFVIASNMIHHIPYPMKFFREMHRIIKKGGRLIIFEAYCSLTFQLATLIMRHEGFDFTIDVWDDEKPKSDEHNAWHGNIAVPHLIFDNKEKFKSNLGNLFNIEHEQLDECLIFLNSGGVTSKTKYIPMNYFFLKIVHFIDKILVNTLPSIFCMGRKIVLKRN